MPKDTYDKACHILRNLTARLEHIASRCSSCDAGVKVRIDNALWRAEHELAKLNPNRIEEDSL
jgi:hypothetical protein